MERLDRATPPDLVLSRSDCAKLTPGEREPILEAVGRVFDEHATGGSSTAVHHLVTALQRKERAWPNADRADRCTCRVSPAPWGR